MGLESLKSVHGSSEHRSGSTSSKLELIPSWKIQLLIVHTVSVVTGDQARQKSLQDLAESVFGYLFICYSVHFRTILFNCKTGIICQSSTGYFYTYLLPKIYI